MENFIFCAVTEFNKITQISIKFESAVKFEYFVPKN